MLIHEMFESPSDEPEVAGSRSRLFGLLDSPGNHQVNLQQHQSGHGFLSKHLTTLDKTTETPKNEKGDIYADDAVM